VAFVAHAGRSRAADELAAKKLKPVLHNLISLLELDIAYFPRYEQI